MPADRHHGRPLTAAERRRLAELERELRAEDPTLAAAPRPAVVAGIATTVAVLIPLAAFMGGAVAATSMTLALFAALGVYLLVQHSRRGPSTR